MTSLIIVIAFIVLAVFGMNIAFALGFATMIGIAFFSDFSLITVAQKMVTGIDSYTLLAIPLFMLAGRLMNEGGITERIFALCKAMVGHIKGSLAYVNVISSIAFATMSGSAVADVGGLGQVEIKAMTDEGYPIEYSAAITLASSAIGPIMPPSINFVIYAALAGVSPGALFLAGIFPGLLMGVSLMVLVFILGFFMKYPQSERKANWSEKFSAIKKSILPMMTPVIILGGIMQGIFTPTEASSVAVVYAFILGFFVYKSIKLKDVPGILLDTIAATSIVTFIIACSSAFSWVMVVGDVGEALLSVILSITTNKILILMMLNMVMLILGCFMENSTLLILLAPIFLPIAIQLGIDPVQFGVIMVLNLMIGVVTPPVGTALYVVSSMTGVSVGRLAKPTLLFVVPLIIVLILVTYIPAISLWIPSMFN